MAPSLAGDISSWSVEDVTEWLAAIGLAHKEDLVKAASLNGSALAKASLEDLQKAGFTSLQSKKILRERPNGETTADTAQSSDGLRAENQALRQELAELRSMIVDLQKAGGGTAANPGGAGVVASRPITRIPFCGGAVIEGNLGNILIVKLSSLMLALRINDSQKSFMDLLAYSLSLGSQIQVLTVHMRPGDMIRAEPGAMVHMSSYIDMKAKLGDGMGRLLTGQKIFHTEFTYTGPAGTADTVTLTADFPSEITPIRLEDYGGHIICQRGSLLASGSSCFVSVEFTQSLGAGFFGGEGFVLQGLNGSGHVFLNARGTVITKTLRSGEVLKVATGCLVGFQKSVRYSVGSTGGGLATGFFGGEGFLVTTLTGPGTVWIESHDMSRLWKAMQAAQG